MLFFKYLKLEYWRLLLFGIHIGHSFKNSILFSSWFIFTYRQNILIMNMYKTVLEFKNGFVGYDYCVKFANPIWFINIDRSTEIYVKCSAKMCGEFSYTTFWIHGMITNFLYIKNTIGKLQRYIKHAWKATFRKLEFDWVYSRWSWPRSVLICTIFNNKWPSNECTISATPCLGIVDTNCSGGDTNIATPGNDDSNDSIVFYNSYFCKYIIERKYGKVISWLNNIRKNKRLISFTKWLIDRFYNEYNIFDLEKAILYKWSIEKKYEMDSNLYKFFTFNFKFYNFMKEGVLSFFNLNKANNEYFESLQIYEPFNLNIDVLKFRRIVEKEIIYVIKIFTYYTCKTTWRYFLYIKKKNLSNKIFMTKHSRGFYLGRVWRFDDKDNTNFIKNRFRKNRFYKTFLRRKFYRKNKFVMRFLKFYYLKKYIHNLGFIKFYRKIFMKLSSFAHISYSIYSHIFKKFFFLNIVNNNNYFNNINKFIRYGRFFKWLYLKKNINYILKRIISNKIIKNKIKFFYLYKTFIAFKKSLKIYIKGFFTYFNFYFLFWYGNRKEFRKYLNLRQINKIRKYKNLKNIDKISYYYIMFYKTLFYSKRFKIYFLNNYKKIKLINYNNIFKKYYKIISYIYRKNIIKIPKNWRFSLSAKVKKYFKKMRRYYLKREEAKEVILHGLIRKYNRIKESEKKNALSYIKPFKSNKYIKRALFVYKNNIILNFLKKGYNKNKKILEYFHKHMNFKRFIILFYKKIFIKKLKKMLSFKFNKEHSMIFYYIDKYQYNYEILFDNYIKENIFNKLLIFINNIKYIFFYKLMSIFLTKAKFLKYKYILKKYIKYDFSSYKKKKNFKFRYFKKCNLKFYKKNINKKILYFFIKKLKKRNYFKYMTFKSLKFYFKNYSKKLYWIKKIFYLNPKKYEKHFSFKIQRKNNIKSSLKEIYLNNNNMFYKTYYYKNINKLINIFYKLKKYEYKKKNIYHIIYFSYIIYFNTYLYYQKYYMYKLNYIQDYNKFLLSKKINRIYKQTVINKIWN